MRILMLLSKEWWEPRSRREARALREAGHELFVLARNRDGAARTENDDGVRVERLPSFRRLGDRAARWLSVPLPSNPVWARAARRAVRSVRPDVVHLHDLPLGPLAARLARQAGAPLVFDLHENFPAMMAAGARGPVRRGMVAAGYWRRLERQVSREADALLVVCPEQVERLVALGVDRERISIVGNTLEVDRFDEAVAAARRSEKVELPEQPGVRVVYSGLFGSNRGLDTLLRAMAWIRDQGEDLSLLLVGQGPMMGSLRGLAEQLSLGARVHFTGWQTWPRMVLSMAAATIGVIPHRTDAHIATTYPNKVFEFMALGVPLVVSDAPPLKRIVVDEACGGLAHRSGDPVDLGRALLALASDSEMRRRLGEQGRAAVCRHYDFRDDRDRLLSLYRRLERVQAHDRCGASRRTRPMKEAAEGHRESHGAATAVGSRGG